MSNMGEIYQQLTAVDIEKQKRIWDSRAKGYYGEFKVFCELYKIIPGNCKILMNLNIPTKQEKTTEIDLLLIHETGLYVFEIKHYKGIIYGKDTDSVWTQYFRTKKNSVFENPIEQNGYHINALDMLFPNIPMRSVIVFTNDECEVRIDNENPYIDICELFRLETTITNRIKGEEEILSAEEINDIFERLSVYSPMKKEVNIDGDAAPIYSWIEPVVRSLEQEKQKNKIENEKILSEIEAERQNNILENEKALSEIEAERQKNILENEKALSEIEAERQKNILDNEKQQSKIKDEYLKINKQKRMIKKQKILNIISAVFAVCACAFVTVVSIDSAKNNYKDIYNKKIAEFEQKFKHIDAIDNEYINDLNSYVKVSNKSLKRLTKDAVSFSAHISLTTDIYGIVIPKDAKYIVMTKDGMTFEYDYISSVQYYDTWSNTIGAYYSSKMELSPTQFYGISDVSQVEYIKLTGVELIQKVDYNNKTIKENLELELYSK